jgi:hypothetical protein
VWLRFNPTGLVVEYKDGQASIFPQGEMRVIFDMTWRLLSNANIFPAIDGNDMLLGEVTRVQHVRRATKPAPDFSPRRISPHPLR